ncbi:hypothetical protein [Longimicrobium sp.]|uniref:hypothetical protein n=1 Tax=Longimicrobium sp. TaxID=2029185 RepID=UPI003B3A2AC9
MDPRASRIAPALVLALLAWAPGATAQNVLRFPGKTVEVIGLEDWTLQMLADSVARYGDGVTLDSPDAQRVIHDRLRFPASAMRTFMSPSEDPYTLIHVVEPADSARVRLHRRGADTADVRPAWAAVADFARRKQWRFIAALYAWPRKEVPGYAAADSAEFRLAWDFWTASRDRDRSDSVAIQVLSSDPTVQDRMVAASLLAYTPREEGDRRWLALFSALLDESEYVASTAATALEAALRDSREVDWSPIVADVHAVLDGANPRELDTAAQVLLQAGVDERWAVPLLAGGGRGLLALAGADHWEMSLTARQLLAALRGEDFGLEMELWRAWVNSLRP